MAAPGNDAEIAVPGPPRPWTFTVDGIGPREVALHEAGHAVAHLARGGHVRGVSILLRRPRLAAGALYGSRARAAGWLAVSRGRIWTYADYALWPGADLEAYGTDMMAGVAATMLAGVPYSVSMRCANGDRAQLGWWLRVFEEEAKPRGVPWRRVEDWMALRCLWGALNLLRPRMAAVEALADELVRRGRIVGRARIEAVVRPHTAPGVLRGGKER